MSDLEKQTILIDNFSKPELENRKEHVRLKGIENTLKLYITRNKKKFMSNYNDKGRAELFGCQIKGSKTSDALHTMVLLLMASSNHAN
jgi:hypothetical protein